jgi:hypothetical protein
MSLLATKSLVGQLERRDEHNLKLDGDVSRLQTVVNRLADEENFVEFDSNFNLEMVVRRELAAMRKYALKHVSEI